MSKWIRNWITHAKGERKNAKETKILLSIVATTSMWLFAWNGSAFLFFHLLEFICFCGLLPYSQWLLSFQTFLVSNLISFCWNSLEFVWKCSLGDFDMYHWQTEWNQPLECSIPNVSLLFDLLKASQSKIYQWWWFAKCISLMKTIAGRGTFPTTNFDILNFFYKSLLMLRNTSDAPNTINEKHDFFSGNILFLLKLLLSIERAEFAFFGPCSDCICNAIKCIFVHLYR